MYTSLIREVGPLQLQAGCLCATAPADPSCMDAWNPCWQWKKVLFLMKDFFAFFFFFPLWSIKANPQKTTNQQQQQMEKKSNRIMAMLMRHNFRINTGRLEKLTLGGKVLARSQLFWSNSSAVWLGVTVSALTHFCREGEVWSFQQFMLPNPPTVVRQESKLQLCSHGLLAESLLEQRDIWL